MNSATPDFEALSLLRALFDLHEVDLRPSENLLGRLTGHDTPTLSALLAQLRRAGLVPMGHLGLTMAGLAFAVSLPPFEPRTPATAARPSTDAAA